MKRLVFDRSRATVLAGGIVLLSICLLAVVYASPLVVYFNYLFPLLAVTLGTWLFLTNQPLYFGFMWWVFFLSPFVRRLADYGASSYTPISYIILTPSLVACLSFFTLLPHINKLFRPKYQPVMLALLGVLYGYLVGIIRNGLFAATFDLVQWIMPPLLAFHVLIYWRQYPQHRQVVRSVFTWGALVMGVYGVVQFFSPLPWDVMWMEEARMASIGKPEPFMVRVYSTLNSPGPFGVAMMTALIIIFDHRTVLSRIAAGPGFVAFLLSLVRSAWGSWFVALSYVLFRSRSRARARTLAFIVVAAIVAVPLLMNQAISSRVGDRVETLDDITTDNSFRARSNIYSGVSIRAITEPTGGGLGMLGRAAKLGSEGEVVTFDSGILAIPYTLGWLGTALYLLGLISFFRPALRINNENTDMFALLCVGIALAMQTLLIFSNQLNSLGGLIGWSFLALSLAGRDYHQARTHVEDEDEDYEDPPDPPRRRYGLQPTS